MSFFRRKNPYSLADQDFETLRPEMGPYDPCGRCGVLDPCFPSLHAVGISARAPVPFGKKIGVFSRAPLV